MPAMEQDYTSRGLTPESSPKTGDVTFANRQPLPDGWPKKALLRYRQNAAATAHPSPSGAASIRGYRKSSEIDAGYCFRWRIYFIAEIIV
jgi:hypothetical protein